MFENEVYFCYSSKQIVRVVKKNTKYLLKYVLLNIFTISLPFFLQLNLE